MNAIVMTPLMVSYWHQTEINLSHSCLWFQKQRRQRVPHPAVIDLILNQRLAPSTSWYSVMLELPAVSEDDPDQLAYTPEARQNIDRAHLRVRTTIGKYLRRHWAYLPDDKIRDIVARFTTGACVFKIWGISEAQARAFKAPDTIVSAINPRRTHAAHIVCGIELGPRSCMQSNYGSIPFTVEDSDVLMNHINSEDIDDYVGDHPYKVYSPDLGWAIALRIRKDTNAVDGRALVNLKKNRFVRTYMRNPTPGGWSETDEKLKAWLIAAGVDHCASWHACQLEVHRHPNDSYLLPYIDGSIQTVCMDNPGKWTIRTPMDSDIYYQCDNTDGTGDEKEPEPEPEPIGYCSDCGEAFYEDDYNSHYLSVYEEEVCDNCLRRNYTQVTAQSRRYRREHGDTYWVRDDEVVRAENDDDAYYREDLPASLVWCDLDNCYYNIDYDLPDNRILNDDNEIVQTPETETE